MFSRQLEVRPAPMADIPSPTLRERPLGADTVEKVENRTTPKISQMLSFGQLRRRDVP
jgi:hypothetical protein